MSTQESKREKRNGLVTYPDGTREWFKDDLRHREDGPAVEYTSGACEWYRYDELDREDGPAAEYPNGHREYWVKNKLHREDGPAIERPSGTRGWYLRGWVLTEEQFLAQATEENRARALHAIAVHEMRTRIRARENVS